MANFEDTGKADNANVFEFSSFGKDVQELIEQAVEGRKFSYCPYSGFAVGAALRTSSGKIYTGCNIESSSYTPTICAERTAISKAVSEGHKEFTAIAVVAYQEKFFTSPCGVCRQTISEFAVRDIPVYIAKPVPARVFVTSSYKLLPGAFVPPNDRECVGK